MSLFRLFKWKFMILLETARNASKWSKVNVMCCVLHWRQSQIIFIVFFPGKFFVNLGVHEGKYFLKLDLVLWQMLSSYSEICELLLWDFCGMWLQQSVYSWWALLGIVFSLWHMDGCRSLWQEEKLVLPMQHHTLYCKVLPWCSSVWWSAVQSVPYTSASLTVYS